MKKNAKKFAYIKNLLYLCTRFKKQTNNNPGGNGSQAAKKL